MSVGGDVPDKPMVECSPWRVGVVQYESEALRRSRLARPAQCRRDVISIAGKSTGDIGSVGKSLDCQLEGHASKSCTSSASSSQGWSAECFQMGVEVQSRAHWEHFAHGADIGVRGIGSTKEEAFEQAAAALTGVLTDPVAVYSKTEVAIECEAGDSEALLVEWLNALIYQMAVRKMIFGRFAVRFEGNRLFGRASGEEVDVSRHEPAVEVKGATYTCLYVGKNADGDWIAQCVVDV